MKSVILIRHAKSSWKGDLDDLDRPLNERGQRDAPEMAKRLRKRDLTIDAFIASPSKRTTDTAEYFCSEFGRKKSEIIFKPELYHATVNVFYEVIRQLPDGFNTIVIFSHNNGITDFANELTEMKSDNIPTCGIFAVRATASSWKEFRSSG